MLAHRLQRYCGALFFAGCFALSSLPASAQLFSFMPVDRSATPYQQTDPDAVVQDDNHPSAALRRQMVSYPNSQPSGTVIIDTAHAFLYLTINGNEALRYGIGVGRRASPGRA